MKVFIILLLASPLMMVRGQQAGTHTPEVHPKLPWSTCKADGACTTTTGGVVIDAEFRWLHNSADKNCYNNGKADATICPDLATCSKNCAFEGADYKGYGVTVSGNALHQTLKPGSRLYLTTANDTAYQMFHLLDQEFTFDVDTSKVPCGGNGALYLVSMEADGGMSKNANNKAGAKYGMGYCDAQCARNMKFNFQADTGACCSEMDLWEANNAATVLTGHPCTPAGYHMCSGSACQGGTCEQGGCGFNPYAAGSQSFYGPGKTVDTNKVFTVVTQFITTGGELTDIKRFYVQGGKVIANPTQASSGANSLSTKYCASASTFNTHGGLKEMGAALKTGMVLAFSLWDDAGGHMAWLDSGSNGPCAASAGDPATIEAQNPYVIWSNLRTGPINSTFGH